MIYVDAFFKTALIGALVYAAIGDIRKQEVTSLTLILCGVISLLDTAIMLAMGTGTASMALLSLFPGCLMLLISKATAQGLGYGDGLMALCAAPCLGLWKTALGLMIAVFLCGVISLFLLVLKKAKGKTRIPFLPFMAAGMGVMMLAKI